MRNPFEVVQFDDCGLIGYLVVGPLVIPIAAVDRRGK